VPSEQDEQLQILLRREPFWVCGQGRIRPSRMLQKRAFEKVSPVFPDSTKKAC
jgi:hypothetical protein